MTLPARCESSSTVSGRKLVEDGKPIVHRRGRAGEQQQCAGEEGQGAGDLRHDRVRCTPRRAHGRARGGPRCAPSSFAAEQSVATRAGRGSRRRGRRAASRAGIGRHIAAARARYRLEYPEAAGHVADDAGGHRRGVGAEEGEEAHVRLAAAAATTAPRRSSSGRTCRARSVRSPMSGPGAPQRPAADLKRARRERGPQRVGRDHAREQHDPERTSTSAHPGAAWRRHAPATSSEGQARRCVASPMPIERLQKPCTVATSIAVSPADAYSRKRIGGACEMPQTQRVSERVGDERREARCADRRSVLRR